MGRLRSMGLSARVIVVALATAMAAVLATLLLTRWLPPWLAALSGMVVGVIAASVLAWQVLGGVRALFRTLAGTVAAYRDGDFSFGIHWDGAADLAELVAAHNALGDVLRDQRQALVQRELLLDTVLQNTPVAMLLLDPSRHVVLGNLAARRLLGEGRRLEGRSFDAVLEGVDPAVREAFSRRLDGLFTVGRAEDEDIYHLARRHFLLNGRAHELVMLRLLTAELRRQEVQTWKKVIRVISHELNNSLAPIASLAHSGAELLRRGQHQRLPLALATIEERARHLEGFIHGYARFAKLPTPQPVELAWRPFIDRLATQATFEAELEPEDGRACFDAAQLEQALLNLLKNAHESGSVQSEVRLTVRRAPQGWRIEVRDRGEGMNEAVLANALLPFYSTKRQGTGLGLALAREIIEAHGGRIGLGNRDGGGLCVSLLLPAPG